ncbi:MAG: precorrin-4 C(11)-methyltransferase [Thermodesulfobacteriota bacterium]
MNGRVYFVGAGPGDPELVTVKGARLLAEADVVVYAGSLVKETVIRRFCREGVAARDSASMTLDEIVGVMAEGVLAGHVVVRLQTGDPSLYGAMAEQIEALGRRGLDVEVVPGVSSAFASAAALKTGLTVPEGTQTVIFTRVAGRTPVPDSESLASLASHGATLCIFLSVGMIEKVTEGLSAGYGPETPVAVVYRASWKDELVVRGTLSDIAGRVREAGITRHAMIIVGPALAGGGGKKSRLYDGDFSHGFRGK